MVSSHYQQPLMGSIIVATPDLSGHESAREPTGDQLSFARADCADARWHVRVVLAADPNMAVQSVRVIVDDRDTRRILLQTLWTDWQEVPILAAHLVTWLPTMEALETTAWDLAAALVSALQHDADGCLEGLGAPIGSRPVSPLGPQERAAMRNVRDATMQWREATTRPRAARAGTGVRV